MLKQKERGTLAISSTALSKAKYFAQRRKKDLLLTARHSIENKEKLFLGNKREGPGVEVSI